MKKKAAITLLLTTTLSACGWVDSTGLQANDGNAYADPSLAILNDGDAFEMQELSNRVAVFNDSTNTQQNWTWKLLDSQANIETCLKFSDFKREHLTNTLERACTDASRCSVDIVETFELQTTRFKFNIPQLKTSAALAYQASSTDNEGNTVNKNHTVCALSINEAPTVENDDYQVSENGDLIVDGADANSLLANDYDDNDIRNTPLKVNTTPVTAPRYAEEFTLYDNGSFYYKPTSGVLQANAQTLTDSFSYAVTDGQHTVEAQVNIDIVAFNSEPVRIAPLLNLALFTESTNIPYQLVDFNDYFQDADGDALVFSLARDSLPESGNLTLTREGLLLGFVETQDIGRYNATVFATDGGTAVNGQFTLNITEFFERNGRPAVSDIRNKTVRDSFEYDVSVFFSDVDEDVLSFTAENLPNGVSISEQGVISGTADNSNTGTWLVRVTADDQRGGQTSDSFRLRIR